MYKEVAVARDLKDTASKALLKGIALTLVVSGFIFLLFASPVKAQSSDVQALLDRMNRLEADLNSVQRKVFQGADVPAPTVGAVSQPLTGGGEAFALLSARIDAMELEQRRLTGNAEEMTYKLDQIKSRMDRLVLDVDYRLTQIEQKLAGGPVASAPASTDSSNGAASNLSGGLTATENTSSGTATVAEGGNLPAGTQLLGTLSASNSASEAPASANTNSDAAPVDLASQQPQDLYNHAMGLIRSDDYAGAEQAFLVFLQNNKTHSLAGNAQYWLGETYYVRGDFNNAASAFLNGYQNYPDSSKASDNLLKLGMTLGRMDQVKEACATFAQMEKQFTILPSRLKRIADREKTKFNCS